MVSARRSAASAGTIPVLLLAIGVAGVSVSALIAHRALAETTPLMLAALRMGAAAVFFLLLRLAGQAGRKPEQPVTASNAVRLAGAGVVLAIHFLAWFASLCLTTVSIATLLVCTTPLWTAIGQVMLGRNRADRGFWLSLAVAVLGMALVVRPESNAPLRASALLGDGLALIGGLMYAVYLLAIDGLQHYRSSRIVTWTYTWAAVVLWIVVLIAGHPAFHFSTPVWEAIALLIVVPQIVGHTLLNHALNYFDAHVVAFSVLAEPIIAAGLAVVLLHELVTPIMVAGGVLVLICVAVVLRGTSGKPAGADWEEL
jgi:drug/metabolite transporter (DMT)-like permease